jgi:hypothetical protein
MNEALTLYDGGSGNNFQFMHFWNILKNEPKWTTWLVTAGYIQNQNRPSDAEECNTEMATSPERPMGRDQAKNQCSTPSSVSQSNAYLEVLQKMSMDHHNFNIMQAESSKKEGEAMQSLMREQVDLQNRMVTLKEEKEAQKLMVMDIEALPHHVQEYFILKQDQILAKAREQSLD